MKKSYNLHGIISLFLFLIAFAVGIAAIVPYSILLGFASLAIDVAALIVISVVYCSKCPCRDNCNHLIVGKLSVLFSKKRTGEYNTFDLVVGVVIPVLVALSFPQYWLFKNMTLLLIYWGCIAIAGIEIYFFVCSKCNNTKCTMCRNKM